jgi:putative isomerase
MLSTLWRRDHFVAIRSSDGAPLAKKVREDFCRMAQQGGMYENFDATTGDGLRDPAYTWTSSVYLIFAHQLLSGRN